MTTTSTDQLNCTLVALGLTSLSWAAIAAQVALDLTA